VIDFFVCCFGCELNIATEAANKEINHALCCGYSFGGQTAAIVIKKYEENA